MIAPEQVAGLLARTCEPVEVALQYFPDTADHAHGHDLHTDHGAATAPFSVTCRATPPRSRTKSRSPSHSAVCPKHCGAGGAPPTPAPPGPDSPCMRAGGWLGRGPGCVRMLLILPGQAPRGAASRLV